MRILFLDIDGVLNTDALIEKYDRDYICPSRVARVDDICESAGADIVLTSTWVEVDGFNKTVAFLREAGLMARVRDAIDFDVELTVDEANRSRMIREKQINDYVSRHTLTRYVTLDDLPLSGVRLVHVDNRLGLCEFHVSCAITYLCY